MIVGRLASKSTIVVSKIYTLKITPPGYFFAVWFVINGTQFDNNFL